MSSNTNFSYQSGTMAMLFNAPRNMWPKRPLLCVSKNSTNIASNLAKVRYAYEPIKVCKWTTFLLTCPIVDNPQTFALTDTRVESSTVMIPYRRAVSKKMGVVACFSPLFYNERWQLLIPILEIYRQLGVELQNFYVQSMIGTVFDFLRVYEKEKIAKIVPWNLLSLNPERYKSLGYDPNTELEWRNQPTAHMDCFLRYKQAAEFIIISDIDDMLFPKLGADYLSEFRRLSSSFPKVATFSYSRYNTEVISSIRNSDFSLSSLINSARISSQFEEGKYVVVPKHVETTWLHWPGIKKDDYKMYRVDESLNIMVHMRNWSMVDYNQASVTTNKKPFQLFKRQINNYINATSIKKLEQRFHKFIKQHGRENFGRLPKDVRYYPLIEQCYDRIFYNKAKVVDTCPGPLRCDLPPVEGLKCAVAKKIYRHERLNNIQFHFPINDGTFVINENGCSM